MREGQVQQRLAFRHGLLQTAGGRGVERLPLDLEHRFLMDGIEHELVAIIGACMAGDLDGAIENAHAGIGSHQRQLPADGFRRDGVVVEIEANIDGLVRTHRLDPVGGERMQGRGQQTGLFFGEGFADRAVVAARPAPLMSDLIAPEQSLPVAFGQCGEGAARPEGIAHIADGAFHASFLIARAHLAGPWREVIVRAEFDQARVKQDLIAATFQHGAFEIVVKNHSRLPGPGLKGMNVAAQEVLHGLIEEELQIQCPRIGQRDHEAGQSAPGTAHHHVAEVRPIDLRLLAGKSLQLQERLAALRTQAGHGAPQLHDAAAVSAIANHLVDARGAQTGMLFQGLAEELDVGIDDGGTQWLGAVEAFASMALRTVSG